MLCLTGFTHAQNAEHGKAERAQRTRTARGGVNETVRSGIVTAPDGQVAITSIDRKWDNKTGTGTLNEAAVTPDGKIYTREANLTRNPDGTITAKGTFTDFDGRSFNYTETTKKTSTRPVEIGRMIDVDGKVSTYETTTTKTADNQIKRTMAITNPDGSMTTRIELLAPARAPSGI